VQVVDKAGLPQGPSNLVTGTWARMQGESWSLKHEDCMQRIYQWLRQRAITSCDELRSRNGSHTVRKKVTVLSEEKVLLIAASMPGTFDRCPACGQSLAATDRAGTGEAFSVPP
jgi:hypothetical protein